jgi:type I restriction enzyme, S subunit
VVSSKRPRSKPIPPSAVIDVVEAPRRAVFQSRLDDGGAQPITVHLDGRVSLRSRVKPFTSPMFLGRKNDIVYSRIDIHNGAVGLLNCIPIAVVTNEYPILTAEDPDDALFVQLLLRSQQVQQQLRFASSGTTGRKRVAAEELLSMALPVPPASIRHEMVKRYRTDDAAASAAESLAGDTRGDAWHTFQTSLGFVTEAKPTKQDPVRVERFALLDRWDLTAPGRAVSSDRYKMAALEEFAQVRLGAQVPRRGHGVGAEYPYLRAANVGTGVVDLSDVKSMRVSPASAAALRLRADDLLLVEGSGSPSEVGRCALWADQLDGCIHQNSVVRARLDRSVLTPDFVMAWFNSPIGRSYFSLHATTTSGLYHIGAGKVGRAPIPIPSRSDQIRLSRTVHDALTRATESDATASRLRNLAKIRFESALFEAAPLAISDSSSPV